VQGAWFELDLGELIQREMYMGTFEPAEARAARRLLRPGDTFVDAGANAGFFTAMAARAVGPQGRVVAYEPSPSACDRLRALVARNRWTQVEVVQAALGEAPGTAMLYWNPASNNHTPSLLDHDQAVGTEVEVRTLTDEAARLGLGEINLLKVDVEGYEARVLRGGASLLASGQVRAVLCEFNDAWLARAGSSAAALTAELEGVGLVRIYPRGVARGNLNRFYQYPGQ